MNTLDFIDQPSLRDDIPAFNARMIEEFAEGRHAGQSA